MYNYKQRPVLETVQCNVEHMVYTHYNSNIIHITASIFFVELQFFSREDKQVLSRYE